MRDPEDFDAFYIDARERLLLQTYALTGDLPAARAAVRDAFIVAWHHWRKIGRLEDPEESVRPHAWRHAQRRHTARLWHRDRSIDPEITKTFEALSELSAIQRKALLLTQLGAVTMSQMAREIGRPIEDAERELQGAATAFAQARGIHTSQIHYQLANLRRQISDVRWPRATILRRAGGARRRTHTLVGAATAVAALVISGSVVTDTTGVRPSLDRPVVAAGQAQAQPATPSPSASASPEPEPEPLTDAALIGTGDLSRLTGRKGWKLTGTSDNSEGNGLAIPCQEERYADPRGSAALLRTFEAKNRARTAEATAFQSVEESRNVRAAQRTLTRTLDWYAGCRIERAQVLSTQRLPGVGDEATLIVVRVWGKPDRTMAVTVARTGVFTTTVMTTVANAERANTRASARTIGGAVGNLCALPEAGECATTTKLQQTAPLPVGSDPALLSEIDLPPISGVAKPWVGTEPSRAENNLASTRCDETQFKGRFNQTRIRNNMTRSFLIPQAKLAKTFGLTQTVGSLPKQKAKAFVEGVRQRLAGCQDKDLGTRVTRLVQRESDKESLTVWTLTTELSDNRSLDYSMAIIRHGGVITQIGFIPDGSAAMSNQDFLALAQRAQDRLPQLKVAQKKQAQKNEAQNQQG
ncbi:hypothetical protein GCM10027020_04360 [Nocardioides salsibiostraticola]